MRAWLSTSLEVLIAVVLAVGVALLLSAWIPTVAAVGAGMIVLAIVCLAIVIAAQIPPTKAGS
jgi:hypothetical protein